MEAAVGESHPIRGDESAEGYQDENARHPEVEPAGRNRDGRAGSQCCFHGHTLVLCCRLFCLTHCSDAPPPLNPLHEQLMISAHHTDSYSHLNPLAITNK